MKFLLLFFLSSFVTVFSASSILHVGVLSDPRIALDTTIASQLIPTLKNLTLDYLLLTGSFTGDPTETDATTMSNLNNLLTNLIPVVGKMIFWIPGILDGNSLFMVKNMTTKDVNVYENLVTVVSGLYVGGLGMWKGSTEMNFTNLGNQVNQLQQNSTVILLTSVGPYGFSTTLRRSNEDSIDVGDVLDSTLWNDTGSNNLTTFLGGAQSHVVVNVHGGNPQGVGDATYGSIKIINPGSTYSTKSLVSIELIQNALGSWVPNNWKFYRFGNITDWSPQPGGYQLSVLDTCQFSKTQVSSPYVSDIYSKISIALYCTGIVAIVVLLGIYVYFSHGQEQV